MRLAPVRGSIEGDLPNFTFAIACGVADHKTGGRNCRTYLISRSITLSIDRNRSYVAYHY
jgi:hypothetical protein